MGYEAKVILKAIIKILEYAPNLEEAIDAVKDLANVEEMISDKGVR